MKNCVFLYGWEFQDSKQPLPYHKVYVQNFTSVAIVHKIQKKSECTAQTFMFLALFNLFFHEIIINVHISMSENLSFRLSPEGKLCLFEILFLLATGTRSGSSPIHFEVSSLISLLLSHL